MYPFTPISLFLLLLYDEFSFFFFFLHLALILALHGKKSVASCSKLEDQAEIIRGRNSDRPTLPRAKLLLRQKPSRKFSLSFIKISREIVRINAEFLSFSLLISSLQRCKFIEREDRSTERFTTEVYKKRRKI